MTTPIHLLHFADAHIDIANYGRHDAESALPIRVMDFLSALDQIVDAGVAHPVDLVIFAGDAYKDRNPQPTFQREWGQRMMRLSQAGIPTILLVGNHDLSPASGRAHTLHEFNTLGVPHIHVADKIDILGPDKLGLPVQVITVPWVSRSRMLTREEMAGKTLDEVLTLLEGKISDAILQLIEDADPNLPLILTAHASVHGAVFGSERAVMLGHELVLSGRIVNDKRLDYVALGHIHKHQALNAAGSHPPIIYPGSIERIDFGEVREKKGFVLAQVSKGQTDWEFVKLNTRRFLNFEIDNLDADKFMEMILNKLPQPEEVAGAICRVQLSYPRDWEPLLDDNAIMERFKEALSIQIQKHRLVEKRARLGDTAAVESLSPTELLDTYWQTIGLEKEETGAMQTLAQEVLGDV
jgi:DNA repair protein SbcD/Mre11